MKRLVLFPCLFALLSSLLSAADRPAAKSDSTAAGGKSADVAGEKWISLFNGKDLEGWTPKIRLCDLGDNYQDTFRVVDGYLTVNYDGYPKFEERFGHLFYKDRFSKYRLRLEYRFIGEQCKGGPGWANRNSGIMIHGEDPAGMEKNQKFPTSIEVQLLGGQNKGERSTGNLCTPGTNVVMNGELITKHCTNSTSKTYDGDQWVTIEVEVHGDKVIHHKINGETVMTYEQAQLDPTDPYAAKLIKDGKLLLSEGTISLQSESHPVQFRNIELLVLDE
ncbi:3-keto-disaccharide hydrolase [Planctomicrobium sp. SH664]|uniref:3-keto-disaccharide hydrolase n=1 Tax=Planctomicrobium sp. SH664 TaxID=3448125 RepID=UPI003F5CB721